MFHAAEDYTDDLPASYGPLHHMVKGKQTQKTRRPFTKKTIDTPFVEQFKKQTFSNFIIEGLKRANIIY